MPPIPKFSIVDLGNAEKHLIEQLGTRQKFWYLDPDRGGRTLCKISRPNTGEDWSEVVAAELADFMSLPHARYELATYQGLRAVITPTIVPQDGSLVLGSELLMTLDPTYDVGIVRFKQTAHTLPRVVGILELPDIRLPIGWAPLPGIHNAADVFLGYLALDALIGNTDRHHQNWGLVVTRERPDGPAVIHLAPTFDHASSLGCHETDAVKTERLNTRDAAYDCSAYARRARSPFFLRPPETRRLLTLEAFAEGARGREGAAQVWLRAIERIRRKDIDILMERVPPERISRVSCRFAAEIVEANRARLLDLNL